MKEYGLSSPSIFDLNFALPFTTHMTMKKFHVKMLSTLISLSVKSGRIKCILEIVINIKLGSISNTQTKMLPINYTIVHVNFLSFKCLCFYLLASFFHSIRAGEKGA